MNTMNNINNELYTYAANRKIYVHIKKSHTRKPYYFTLSFFYI